MVTPGCTLSQQPCACAYHLLFFRHNPSVKKKAFESASFYFLVFPINISIRGLLTPLWHNDTPMQFICVWSHSTVLPSLWICICNCIFICICICSRVWRHSTVTLYRLIKLSRRLNCCDPTLSQEGHCELIIGRNWHTIIVICKTQKAWSAPKSSSTDPFCICICNVYYWGDTNVYGA